MPHHFNRGVKMEDNIDSLIARIQEYRVEEEIEDDFTLSRDSYSMEAYQSNPLSYMYTEEDVDGL